MRNLFLLTAVTLLAVLSACKKENNGVQLQPHDENRMMDTMHAMMDGMEGMPMTNDPEVDFVKMMIMHHQGAISMATLELQAGKNDSLKRTAQKIINEQQSEIQELNTILSTLTVDNSDPEFSKEQMDNMTKMGKTADVQLITGNIDNDFATLMIVHHQSAIDNAYSYLHHGNNEEIKTMASDMISAQNEEIVELSNWLIANRR